MNFTAAPNTDLQGALLEYSLQPSAGACLVACCNQPACTGVAYDQGGLDLQQAAGSAGCYLYANVTQLVPSSTMDSALYGS